MSKHIDQHWKSEIILYFENSWLGKESNKRQYRAFVENALRRLSKGTYDTHAGVRLWMYLADRLVGDYSVEDMGRTHPTLTIVDKATRTAIAEKLQEKFLDEVNEGEHDSVTGRGIKRAKNPGAAIKLVKIPLSDVRHYNQVAGGKFFDTKTMKFFGETLKNFSRYAYKLPGAKYAYFYKDGPRTGFKIYMVDTDSWVIWTVSEEKWKPFHRQLKTFPALVAIFPRDQHEKWLS